MSTNSQHKAEIAKLKAARQDPATRRLAGHLHRAARLQARVERIQALLARATEDQRPALERELKRRRLELELANMRVEDEGAAPR